MPARMRGVWALPDCRSYDQALIITPHFYLQTDNKDSRFWPIGPDLEKKDYWVMPVAGVIRPVKVTADGQLTIGIPHGKNPSPWPRRWSGLALDNQQDYMACAMAPTILPAPLIRAMRHIDRIAAVCRAGMTADCQHALFDAADKNKDGKISPQEMKSAAAMLGDMALLVKRHTVSRAALARAHKTNMREAERLAKRLMPKGGGMSFADFNGFMEKARSKRLAAALDDIAVLIPGFKP